MEEKQKLWQTIGAGFLGLAILSLLIGLYYRRLQYIDSTSSPFFSNAFLVLCFASLLFHLLIGVVVKLLPKRYISLFSLLWPLLSLILWRSFYDYLPGFKVYAGVYLIWLFLFTAGLLILVNGQRLSALRWGNHGRILATISFICILSLLLLEILIRIYFNLFGSPQDKIAYLYSIDEIIEVTNRYQGFPYINYGLTPTHPEHNGYGYRGEAFESPKPEGVYRIFTLGGSTTFGASLSPDESYPAQLQRVLREDYGYTNVEVVNAGVSAYASADSLANLAYHVLDDEPNMIIIYDNINDVRARLVAHEDYSGLNLQRGIWSPDKLGNSLSPFVLLRFIQIQLGIVANPNNIESLIITSQDVGRCTFRLNEMCEELGVPAQEILDSNPPIYFERNLRNMVAIANANDVDVVFATWAYYSGETPLNNIMNQEYVRNAVDEHNEILRNLANELDLPLIDFSSTVPVNGTYWQDGMHMTAEGTAEQARQFAAFLVENQLLPEP